MSDKLFPIVVHVLLIRANQIYLIRRANTGFEDGKYSLIGGHLDGGETVSQAAIRECFEEIGVLVGVEHVALLGVEHYKSTLGDSGEGVDFYCRIESWQGEPWAKSECDHCAWFDLDDLPENMIEFMRNAVLRFTSKEDSVDWFSEIGF